MRSSSSCIYLGLLLLWLVAARPAAAQSGSYAELFTEAYEKHAAGDPAGASLLYLKCLELRPRSGKCAYYLACSAAASDEPAEAREWLDRAAEWG